MRKERFFTSLRGACTERSRSIQNDRSIGNKIDLDHWYQSLNTFEFLFFGPEKMKSNFAFTLVELLVVISIIALLLGILLPTLGKARMYAKRVVSASNMCQIGVALEMYADNNKGFFPETAHGFSGTEAEQRSWIYTLSSYIGDVDKVRICPADPKRKKRLENKVSSYIMNGYIAYDNIHPFLGTIVGPSYRNMHKLKRPAETITTFVGSDVLSAHISSDHTHSNLWFWPPPNVPWDAIQSEIQVDRYKNSTLLLYAESHVEPVKKERIKEMADNYYNFAKPPK